MQADLLQQQVTRFLGVCVVVADTAQASGDLATAQAAIRRGMSVAGRLATALPSEKNLAEAKEWFGRLGACGLDFDSDPSALRSREWAENKIAQARDLLDQNRAP